MSTSSAPFNESDDDAAARWAIRLEQEALSDAEGRELDAWISANPRRRGLLLRAEAALSYLDRGRALAGPGERIAASRYGTAIRRRSFLVGGSLAGLAAASVVTFLLGAPIEPLEIRTAVGEVRRVPLADGSVASVNTNSKVAVVLRENRREVKLDDGEAWFQVAHDKARPFIVEAGPVRVQAVGTAFSVRRRDGGADILVTDGIVDAWVAGRDSPRTRIAAGSKTFVGTDAPKIEVVHAAGDIDRQLAWRTGELALNGESLFYAAAELNRYNARKLVIEDPKLGREPLVGYFRTDQPENFGRAAAGMLGAKVVVDADTIRIGRE